jgi:hypothetical protein
MLCLLLVGRIKKRERKRKKKKEMARGLFSKCRTHLVGCAVWDFLSC